MNYTSRVVTSEKYTYPVTRVQTNCPSVLHSCPIYFSYTVGEGSCLNLFFCDNYFYFSINIVVRKKVTEYMKNDCSTAIFLINGLCIVYRSHTQCLTLVYPGWGQKSEFFRLLVTTRRPQPLRCGTACGLP